jgi:hypothetical protein
VNDRLLGKIGSPFNTKSKAGASGEA